MSGLIRIRQAAAGDVDTVASILAEAAQWQQQLGTPVWLGDELNTDKIVAEIAEGLFFLAESSGEGAGTLKFQLDDPIFWPDEPAPHAAYIHRMAVRRRYAGRGISAALVTWAVERTRQFGRHLLRLDCGADRPKLRAVYEDFGFRHHSYSLVGHYSVARYEY